MLKSQILEWKSKFDKVPGLAVILVGNDPASQVYVKSKQRTCEAIGIKSFEYRLSADTNLSDLLSVIDKLNNDDSVHGILLQLPLPDPLDSDVALQHISPDKDVDGFHPNNVGKLLIGLPTFKSCTPYGVMTLLSYYNIETEGKHIVILGRSNIVGKPLAALLMQKTSPGNATVTVCHSRSKNLNDITLSADIIIAAIGRPHFLTEDMVNPGAVVIDVGINRIDDSSLDRGYRLVGDVDYDALKLKVSAITPVPGGVGPLTIAMLMTNTCQAFEQQIS